MRTRAFDYELPRELIAQAPAGQREAARLLVVDRKRAVFSHHGMSDLPGLLCRGDLLVVNDTRVIPARLHGRKARGGGRVELLLLEERGPGLWEALLRASRRPQPGEAVQLAGGAWARVIEEGERGRCRVRIDGDLPIPELLERYGETPLPPYIDRRTASAAARAEDRNRYQTVYARVPGAVAAPTAGLHFTPALLQALETRGIPHARITLHVGIGTFRPVEVERVEDHRMDAERFEIPPETAHAIASTRVRQGRVVAVGTTTVRTLETAAVEGRAVAAARGRTSLFIYPPYPFAVTDALLTNFHLPRSTLLMMVCAFGGAELILRAYHEAVAAGYRFYSYGDAMLIV